MVIFMIPMAVFPGAGGVAVWEGKDPGPVLCDVDRCHSCGEDERQLPSSPEFSESEPEDTGAHAWTPEPPEAAPGPSEPGLWGCVMSPRALLTVIFLYRMFLFFLLLLQLSQ